MALIHVRHYEPFGVVVAMAASAVPIVRRPGGLWIDIVQIWRYVWFVDEEIALAICRSVGLSRELGGRVVERHANSPTKSLGREFATLSRD